MKYPIDAEKYIAAMWQEFGPNQAAKNAHREIIPFVNDAYAAGLSGEDSYPVDADTEIAAFAGVLGTTPERVQHNGLLPRLIQWVNSAYEQGRQDAGRATARKSLSAHTRRSPAGFPHSGIHAAAHAGRKGAFQYRASDAQDTVSDL